MEYKKIEIPIIGMSPPSCAETIEKKLRGIEGVIEVTVSSFWEKARIEYDPCKVEISDFKKIIENAGYNKIVYKPYPSFLEKIKNLFKKTKKEKNEKYLGN